jgi:hypothetical protein
LGLALERLAMFAPRPERGHAAVPRRPALEAPQSIVTTRIRISAMQIAQAIGRFILAHSFRCNRASSRRTFAPTSPKAEGWRGVVASNAHAIGRVTFGNQSGASRLVRLGARLTYVSLALSFPTCVIALT